MYVVGKLMINELKNSKRLAEFIRFCAVGALCTFIDAAIFYTVGLFACYQLALVSGYCLSLVINYFLTIYWTFKVKPTKKNLAGLVGAHLFNLFVIRMGCMWLFIHMIGFTENVAYVPTLLISIVLNFMLVKWVVE